MAGGWGASIHAPMTTGEEPYIPGKYLPEEAEIAALVDASVGTLRRQGTLVKAMPPLAQLGTEKFSNSNYRAIEAAEFAQAMKVAHNETKMYNRAMKNRAKAKDRAKQRWSERR